MDRGDWRAAVHGVLHRVGHIKQQQQQSFSFIVSLDCPK